MVHFSFNSCSESCSVPCYKYHRTNCPSLQKPGDGKPQQVDSTGSSPSIPATGLAEKQSTNARALRPLSSLRWPYIPEPPSFHDPLSNSDPKSLGLAQYETIATASSVRSAIGSHPRMENILRSLDQMNPPQREAHMQRLLGLVNGNEPLDETTLTDDQLEDSRAFQNFAAAIEQAIRSSTENPKPGLDWEL